MPLIPLPFIRYIAAVIFLCSSTLLFAQSAEIHFKKRIGMEFGKVLLGDIAVIKSTDASLRARLKKIYVMKSPRVGYVEKITEDQIRKILNSSPDLRNIDILFSGEKKTVIHSRGKKYSYEHMVDLAKKRLLKELGAEHRRVDMRFSKKNRTINLPYGELTFKSRMNAKAISQRMCVWIDVYRKNNFYRSVPVWAKIAVYDSVYVANHYIEKNSVVSEDDFSISIQNIAVLSDKHLKINEFKQDFLLKQSIESGGALRIDNVKKVPAVIAGTVLDATVSEGAVSISVKVIARKDAEIGEVIKVRSLQSGSILKTVVTGKQLVEVI